MARISRSPRGLRIACNHAGLTHFGGIYFFHEFLRVLHIRQFLARNLDYSRRNERYSVSQMILALVYPIILGLDRIETASFLSSNSTFQYLTGLQSFPDSQTLHRFLRHAPPRRWEQLHGVNDRLLQNFISLPDHRSRLIFDLDSTVVTKDLFVRAMVTTLRPSPEKRLKTAPYWNTDSRGLVCAGSMRVRE